MQYRQTPQGILIEDAGEFDLAQTLDCGQCFRWEPVGENAYQGIAMGRCLLVARQEAGVLLKGCTWEEFNTLWRPYFDLDRDYARIRRRLGRGDPILRQACAYAPGLRLLRQEPFEALCSFILSQNNRIPRIKAIISRLCALLGEPLEPLESLPNTPGAYAFPTPQRLAGASVEELSPLRCGYRAAYLLDAAQQVAGGRLDLAETAALPLEDARRRLMEIKGVGNKVADCVLLYGMHRLDAFPMDVWIKRAMAHLYPGETAERFGPYAGIAQQYLFHYSRMHPGIFTGAEPA